MKLTDQQKGILYRIVTDFKNGEKEVTLGGFAGTGKTTICKYLTKFFPGFGVCAYTGKATNVLRKKGISATTIHSRIYAPEFKDGVVYFDLKSDPDCCGFIVDESSMVSQEIYEDLKCYGLPMIFIGDHGQLEPIGCDFNLMKNPRYRLEEIHRNAGDIAKFAEHIRHGYAARGFKSNGKVRLLNKKSVTDKHLTSVDQVICAYNKTRVEINQRIRKHLGFKKELHVGERVMCLRNNRHMGLFNGMQGIVTGLSRGKRGAYFMDFLFDGMEYYGIPYDPSQFGQEKYKIKFGSNTPNPFDYAYCITAHKCVHPDTIVETSDGLSPIKSIPSEGIIATPYGPKKYGNLVCNSKMRTKNFRTRCGYNITTTLDHKVEIWKSGAFQLIEAKDVKKVDLFRVYIGSQFNTTNSVLPEPPKVHHLANIFDTPCEINEHVAEFLGLMVADGTIWNKGFRLAKRHQEVVRRFIFLCQSLFGVKAKETEVHGTPAAEVHSSFISQWLLQIDGLSPHKKDIPNTILHSNICSQHKFLRGLFEDGWVSLDSKTGNFDHIGWSSKFPSLVNKTRLMLLRCGIVCGELSTKPDNNLFIYGNYATKFKQQIGFISDFKMNRIPKNDILCKYDMIPISKEELEDKRQLFVKDPILTVYDYQNARQRGFLSRSKTKRLADVAEDLRAILQNRLLYFYTEVSKIEETECLSMCVEVFDGHRFIQNGFPFSNSQGDEWDRVLVFEQKCKNWDHRRWGYTAGSRAKEELDWALA